MANRNAADPEQVNVAAQKSKSARERELNDMREILATPAGRRFIWRYMGDCGLFSLSFTGNSTTFFNEGMRNIGLKLLTDVTEARPEAYLEMALEAKKREEETNA